MVRFVDYTKECKGMPSQPRRHGARNVRELYADVVRAIMRNSGRFEARFGIHGECNNSGFWVTMPRSCPQYLVIVGVSALGQESMDDLLGDPRIAIGEALATAGVRSSDAFRTVTNLPATRDNLQCGVFAEVPDEATVRRLYARWCAQRSR